MSEGIWIAIIGLLGVIVGAIASEARHWRKDRAIQRRENRQKKLLRKLLRDPDHEFRRLSTLMHTIAADEDTTKRLLIEIGARASTEGQPIWKMEGETRDRH